MGDTAVLWGMEIYGRLFTEQRLARTPRQMIPWLDPKAHTSAVSLATVIPKGNLDLLPGHCRSGSGVYLLRKRKTLFPFG